MPTFPAERLTAIGESLFTAAGARPEVAREVSRSLVLSNLLGIDSHGVVRIKNYWDAIQAGHLVPGTVPVVKRDQGPAVALDGNRAFGQIAAYEATRLAIRKAREHAIGIVSFGNVLHIGRLGEYVANIAAENLIGIMLTNGSRPGGLVAPFGSRQRRLGTNPLAFGIPAGTQPALIADFSTAAIAEGRVRIAMRKGQPLPPDHILDREGRPSTNPSDLYDGGSIVPFGGYKGFALSLLIEVLGGILSGADTPIFPGYDHLQNGVLLLAIEPTFFRPGGEYRDAVDYLFHAVKNAEPAAGVESVLLPGEPEERRRAEREREGIPLDDSTWNEIQEIARHYGLNLA